MRTRFSLAAVALLAALTSCQGNLVGASSSSSSSSPAEKPVAPMKEQSDNHRNFYEIFVGSFADSDGDGMGDLDGVTQKLDYLKSLNFDGIWLMPIFESHSYHKYDADDYFKIDEDYGTEEDLKELVAAAHERGIKVIIDLALNHSSIYNENFLKSCAAYAWTKGQETSADMTTYLDGMSEAEIEAQAQMYVFRDEAGSGYHQVPGRSFYYEGNFSNTMPEFNFDSPLAWDLFEQVIQYWMSPEHGGVDGYRLDAVIYYYLYNTEKNAQALTRLEDFGREVDPDCYFVGECWQPSLTIADYYAGSDLDSYFWFPAQGSNGFVRNGMYDPNGYVRGEREMIEAAGDDIPAPFISNHDTGRNSLSRIDMAKFQYGLFATLSGNTFNYYGDEIGLAVGNSTNDESKRTHMPWGDGMECDDPANAAPGTWTLGTVSEQLDDPDSLINFVGECNRLRNLYPALGWGEISSYEISPDNLQLVLDKSLAGSQKVRVVYNFDDVDSQEYTAPEGYTLVGELASQGAIARSGSTYTIPAYSIALFAQN